MKITIKHKKGEVVNEIMPKTKATNLLNSSTGDSLKGYAYLYMSSAFDDRYQYNHEGNQGIFLGVKNQLAEVIQQGSPESLGLSKLGHKHTYLEFPAGDGGKTFEQLFSSDKVPLEEDGYIHENYLDVLIRGQMRYKGEVDLTSDKVISTITEFASINNSNSEFKRGEFVIVSNSGYVQFNATNKPYSYKAIEEETEGDFSGMNNSDFYESLNWIDGTDNGEDLLEALEWTAGLDETTIAQALSWEENIVDSNDYKLYLRTGSFIVFVERSGGVNYFAFVRKDVRSATIGRTGMIRLSEKTSGGSPVNITTRAHLATSGNESKVITENILDKLGFEISLSGSDLIFESFE